MPPLPKTISVIISAYNEENNIEGAIANADKVFRQYTQNYELLVFNDGSQDKTGSIAENLKLKNPKIRLIHHEKNKGLAAIAREAFGLAKMNYITWFSGDNTIDPQSLVSAMEAVGKADIVVAYMENPEVRSHLRQAVSKAFTFLINISFGMNVKYFNGPSVYPVELCRSIKLKADGFDFFAELLIRAVKSNHTILEVPFANTPEKTKRSKAFSFRNFRSLFMMLIVLLLDIYFLRKPLG